MGEIPPVLYFTIDEVAAMFRVSVRTVEGWIKKGIVKFRYRCPGGTTIRRVIGYPELNELFDHIVPLSDEIKEGSRQAKIMAWHNANLEKAWAAAKASRERKKAERAASNGDGVADGVANVTATEDPE